MSHHIDTGTLGESCAASFVESLGFQIIARNVRTTFGELDIVAREPDGTLVVIEVKTLSSSGSLKPEDNLTRSKFSKLSRMATFYANRHPEHIDPNFGWRIDLVAIVLNPSADAVTATYGKTNFAVSHYKNVSL